MEYRRQDVESEVEKYQKNRDYQEEAVCIQDYDVNSTASHHAGADG